MTNNTKPSFSMSKKLREQIWEIIRRTRTIKGSLVDDSKIINELVALLASQRETIYKEGYEDGLKADNDPVVELGIHGHDCPDCNGGDCECLCRVCRGLKKV